MGNFKWWLVELVAINDLWLFGTALYRSFLSSSLTVTHVQGT